MAHQYMPKIFHGPHKNPLAPPPTYLMYGPLNNKSNSISNLFTQIFILEVLEFILRNNNFKFGEI